jgi:hypothetical protein
MTVQMNDGYASALRSELIEHVEAATGRSRRIGLRVGAGAGAGVLLVGGGVAAAAGWLSLPGADVVTTDGPTVTATHTGSATVELGAVPKGATDVLLKLTCLTAGTFTFDDGASLSCSPADAGSASGVATYRLALHPGQHRTSIVTTDGGRWTLSVIYAHVGVTDWGVNADGLTYGVANDRGTPDLVAVIATNGQNGYAYNRDLNPPGPTTLQTGGSEASRTVVVYTSDGHTQIGVFFLGHTSGRESIAGG